MTAFVGRNHNGTLIAWNNDLGNLMEELMFYQEVTGNSTLVNEETFDTEPEMHKSDF